MIYFIFSPFSECYYILVSLCCLGLAGIENPALDSGNSGILKLVGSVWYQGDHKSFSKSFKKSLYLFKINVLDILFYPEYPCSMSHFIWMKKKLVLAPEFGKNSWAGMLREYGKGRSFAITHFLFVTRPQFQNLGVATFFRKVKEIRNCIWFRVTLLTYFRHPCNNE